MVLPLWWVLWVDGKFYPPAKPLVGANLRKGFPCCKRFNLVDDQMYLAIHESLLTGASILSASETVGGRS